MTPPQILSLREQLKALEHLQELDLRIDRITKNKDSLPASLKTLDASLGKVKASHDTKKNALTELEKVQRQTQAALELNRDRLQRANGKLEGVQNSAEFQAASKEIDQLKKLNANLEDQSKKFNTDSGTLQKEVGELASQLEKLQGERSTQVTALSTQESQFSGEISGLMSERSKHTGGVDPRTLALYDRVRKSRAGLGIVPAVAGRCKGCNMVVPPQLYNEIQKLKELHCCPSCHRILFVPAANPAPSEGSAT